MDRPVYALMDRRTQTGSGTIRKPTTVVDGRKLGSPYVRTGPFSPARLPFARGSATALPGTAPGQKKIRPAFRWPRLEKNPLKRTVSVPLPSSLTRAVLPGCQTMNRQQGASPRLNLSVRVAFETFSMPPAEFQVGNPPLHKIKLLLHLRSIEMIGFSGKKRISIGTGLKHFGFFGLFQPITSSGSPGIPRRRPTPPPSPSATDQIMKRPKTPSAPSRESFLSETGIRPT